MNSIKLDKETFTWVTKLDWRDGNSFTVFNYYLLMFYDSTSQAKSVTLVYDLKLIIPEKAHNLTNFDV